MLLKNTLLNAILLTVALLFTSNLTAQQGATILEQMHKLNQYWADHNVEAPILEKVITFESDRSLIALHLQLVEKHLRNNPPAGLTESQIAKRTQGLDILKTYWQTGVFPINTHHDYTLPYFIDDFNTACAVGHIMRESGEVALTERIAAENNYAYIRDLQYPEIGEWANNNGFTNAELKWIQPSYGPIIYTTHTTTDPNCGNTNGTIDVTVLAQDDYYYGTSTVTLEDYEWREGVDLNTPIIATTEDLDNAASGFYSLNLPGLGWWQGNYLSRYSLSDVEGPTIDAVVVDQFCQGDDYMGSISLNLDNPEDYEIKWYTYYENELIAEDVTSIEAAGMPDFGNGLGSSNYSYRVEVTDVNGCKTLEEFFVGITNNSPYLATWQSTITPVSCEGNGSIELGTIYGAAGTDVGYSVEWSNGATTENIEDLTAGEYTVTITSDIGCAASHSFTIEGACIDNVNCLDLAGINFGFCDAIIGIGISNGQCITFSGCSTVGNDGVDYEQFFFEDITTCVDNCPGVACPPAIPMCLIPVEPVEYDIESGEVISLSAIEELYPLCLVPIVAAYGENVVSVSVIGAPSNGEVIVNGEDILYESNPNFNGTDQFSYEVCYDYSDPVVDDCFGGDGTLCTSQTIFFNVSTGGTTDCIDLSLINSETNCLDIYAPVCGCDGVTYGNSCYATFFNGVSSYTEGECGTTNTINMGLSLKVFLEGPMNGNGTMDPILSEINLLATHPYDQEPYFYNGPALSGTVPTNAVDYILIELREDFGMPAAAQQVAFVMDNGDIVMEDGSFPQFLVDGTQTYQVWLRHHNHLDIVSTTEITPSNMVENWFLNDADTMGPEQLKEVSGTYCMFAGDLNGDGVINVTDYDSWYLSPAIVNQYMPQDANLDGVIQATDYDAWFENKAKIGYAQQMD